MARSPAEVEARRRWRRIVSFAFYGLLGVLVAVAAGNVTYQVWAPAFRDYPPVDCRAGLAALVHAVDRARQDAALVSEQGEDVALSQFRAALLPEWNERDAVAASCSSNRRLSALLDVVERLRYAEERAVRREVSDLAPLRSRVGQLQMNQLLP